MLKLTSTSSVKSATHGCSIGTSASRMQRGQHCSSASAYRSRPRLATMLGRGLLVIERLPAAQSSRSCIGGACDARIARHGMVLAGTEGLETARDSDGGQDSLLRPGRDKNSVLRMGPPAVCFSQVSGASSTTATQGPSRNENGAREKCPAVLALLCGAVLRRPLPPPHADGDAQAAQQEPNDDRGGLGKVIDLEGRTEIIGPERFPGSGSPLGHGGRTRNVQSTGEKTVTPEFPRSDATVSGVVVGALRLHSVVNCMGLRP